MADIATPLIALPVPDAATERGLDPYIRAIHEVGGRCLIVRPSDGHDPEAVIDTVDGLYLIAGADIHPSRYHAEADPNAGLMVDEARDALEFSLVRLAIDKDLPILGICRGMQLLNVAFGGKLIQDIPQHRNPEGGPEFHDIHILAKSRLAGIIGVSGDIKVNSRHHQAVHPSNLASGLETAAFRTDDGVIEALESHSHTWVLGVQSHPQRKEEMPKNFSNLFSSFVQAALRYGRQ